MISYSINDLNLVQLSRDMFSFSTVFIYILLFLFFSYKGWKLSNYIKPCSSRVLYMIYVLSLRSTNLRFGRESETFFSLPSAMIAEIWVFQGHILQRPLFLCHRSTVEGKTVQGGCRSCRNQKVPDF